MKLLRHSRPDRVLPVEITPMIDVVFLMIIFFMATAQFARMTRAEVDLPVEAGQQERAEEAGIVINITRDDRIIVNDRVMSVQDVLSFVQEEQATHSNDAAAFKLLLRADREATATLLNEVVTALQSAGVTSARVATEVP